MNSINLVGRLVKDPEVKTIGEKKVTSFRMAVKRKFGDKSDFFTCNYWNDNYICQYAQKNSIVTLTGEVQFKDNFTTVVVDYCRILSDGKPKNASTSSQSFESFETFEDYEEISDAEMQGLFDKN